MIPSKDHDNLPDMKISNLLDKELKIAVLRNLSEQENTKR